LMMISSMLGFQHCASAKRRLCALQIAPKETLWPQPALPCASRGFVVQG
jgi:hypothetical protein